MYKDIDSYQLKKILLKENVNLIDIRDNYKYSQGTISNAKNIPSTNLLINPNIYLNKEDNYVVFCQYGSTSKRLCDILSQQGYKVINLIGGYSSYKDSI